MREGWFDIYGRVLDGVTAWSWADLTVAENASLGAPASRPMGRTAASPREGDVSKDEAEEAEHAKWNDAGAIAEELPAEPSLWRGDLPLLTGFCVVLLIDILSIAAIVTAVVENDRPTGT